MLSDISCLDTLNMETLTQTPVESEEVEILPPVSGGSQPGQEASDQTAVTFLSIDSLPNCRKKEVPTEVMNLTHFDLVYFKATQCDANGFYELISPEKPDQKLTLYPSGMRSVIKHLPLAVEAAKSLELNPQMQNDTSTYEVAVINTFNGMSTRLVVNSYQGEVFIYLKLYSTNQGGEVFPTRKSVQFDIKDNVIALAGFIKGKK